MEAALHGIHTTFWRNVLQGSVVKESSFRNVPSFTLETYPPVGTFLSSVNILSIATNPRLILSSPSHASKATALRAFTFCPIWAIRFL